MKLTVEIKGKELQPVARLLEVLTKCGLLHERITWEEKEDKVVITIANATENDYVIFRSKRQYSQVAFENEE